MYIARLCVLALTVGPVLAACDEGARSPGTGGASSSTSSSATTVSTATSGSVSSSAVTSASVSATSSSASSTGSSASASSGDAGLEDIVMNIGVGLQIMDGFGAADTWMGTLTTAQADLFFSPTAGIGLSILRVGIDENGNDLAPYANAKMAAARGAIVWGAPWSPPAASKDNGNIDNGGHLLADDYGTWAATLAGFAAKMQQNAGVQLYGISAQNEPDFTASYASCVYSGDEMLAFVKVLGPALKALDPPVKLLAAEPDVWSDLWGGSNAYGTAICDDADASASVDVLAVHQYANGAVTAPPEGITQHIWETEASGVRGSLQAGPSADIANGIAVAQWIHDAIVIGGASAWHYWWLISLNNDNEGLLAQGGGMTKRLYTMGNFSKFVRPGYQRVATSGPAPPGVSLSAYTDPVSLQVVVVAINSNSDATTLPVYVSASTVPAQVTPWVTSASTDLAAQAAIAVVGGRFVATLPGQSVTTFVSTP